MRITLTYSCLAKVNDINEDKHMRSNLLAIIAGMARSFEKENTLILSRHLLTILI
ncbi:MAG: hypothetical protein ACI936_000915 [Paraglaciecola sp.]|jgi:hypothetical protein